MSQVIALPDDINIASLTLGMVYFDLGHANPDTGATQVAVLGPPRRSCAIVSNEREEDPDMIGRWRALVHALRGRVNRLAVYDALHPEPRGTARGAWTAVAAAAGANAITINAGAGQNGRTLLQGDWIGVQQESTGAGRQLLHVQADAVVAGGQMTVQVEPALRLSLPAGSAIVWDRPTCLMRRTGAETKWTGTPGDFEGGYSLDMLESWE
ncbi:MAG: hypothetical protein EOO29_08360 [Comamonadaceae bacterium]|nr:MAG: hypothetical protein EOO29_08360 [Comamonadaceae bacterium]